MANELTIGTKLRQARLDKNITIDELQQMTKIQKRYLEAIEADRFEDLPGTFYVRAFIRQYAEAVKEDGNKLVAVYDGKETLDTVIIPKKPRPKELTESRKSLHEEEPSSPIIRYLPMILLGLVALSIIFIVGYMTWQDRNATPMISSTDTSVVVENSVTAETTQSTQLTKETIESTQESRTQETSSSKETNEMTIERTASSQSDATLSIKNATGPIQLDFKGLDASCWIGILVNNAYVYQYTLQAGEEQSTTLPEGADNATIVLGASQNVTIKANDKELDFDDKNFKLLQKNVHLEIAYQDN